MLCQHPAWPHWGETWASPSISPDWYCHHPQLLLHLPNLGVHGKYSVKSISARESQWEWELCKVLPGWWRQGNFFVCASKWKLILSSSKSYLRFQMVFIARGEKSRRKQKVSLEEEDQDEWKLYRSWGSEFLGSSGLVLIVSTLFCKGLGSLCLKSLLLYHESSHRQHTSKWAQLYSDKTLFTWCEEPTHWKRPWCWKRLGQEKKGAMEDEMVGWHHQWDGHEFEQTREIVKDREA